MIWVNGKYEIEERNINKKNRYKEIRLGWHGETSGLSYIEILNIINFLNPFRLAPIHLSLRAKIISTLFSFSSLSFELY